MNSIFAYVKDGRVWYEVADNRGNIIITTTDQWKAYAMTEVII